MAVKSLPAFLLASGGSTRVNVDRVIRLAPGDPWLARRHRDADRDTCPDCLLAESFVAPATTVIYMDGFEEVTVLGYLDAVADALVRGQDYTPSSLIEARRQVVSIARACLRDDVTASHRKPGVLVPLKTREPEEADHVEAE